jgi:multidrug resistance efflux pump
MKNRLNQIRNGRPLKIFIMCVVIALVVGGFLYWQTKRDRIFIENSQISTTVIPIAPASSGVLTELDAREGKAIKKGDTIAVVGGETIRSQIDGMVVTTNDEVGGSVSSQSTLVQMIDPSQMRVVGVIDENKGLDQIHVGQVASFTIDAFPGKTFWGYVDQISQTAKQTQAAFSISSERPTQQFQVYVRFDASSYTELKNGMSAKLTIFTKMK